MNHAKKLGNLIILLIKRDDVQIIILGGKEEEKLGRRLSSLMEEDFINLIGKVSLRKLTAFMEKMTLFIGNGSGPLHLAAAMKVPTVAIFGPSRSQETAPYGNKAVVIEKNLPCRQRCDQNTCHYYKRKECLKRISVEEVLKTAEELLKTNEESQLHL